MVAEENAAATPGPRSTVADSAACGCGRAGARSSRRTTRTRCCSCSSTCRPSARRARPSRSRRPSRARRRAAAPPAPPAPPMPARLRVPMRACEGPSAARVGLLCARMCAPPLRLWAPRALAGASGRPRPPPGSFGPCLRACARVLACVRTHTARRSVRGHFSKPRPPLSPARS